MRVSFSVVTYNNEDHISHLLDSITDCVKLDDYHIFVVDNGSTDGTTQIVKEHRNSKITLIENNRNVGFGAGHNKVLDKLNSTYHVIINPDIILNDDVISRMADYLDAHPDIAMLSPKVVYPSGEVQVLPKRDPKLIFMLARRSGIKALKKYKEYYEMADADLNRACDIEFATGCFMFVRTELFKKAGGFDERFFLYMEDADLSRRIREYGRIEYNPEFTVAHHWQQAGAKHLKYLLMHISSMIKYAWKWR